VTEKKIELQEIKDDWIESIEMSHEVFKWLTGKKISDARLNLMNKDEIVKNRWQMLKDQHGYEVKKMAAIIHKEVNGKLVSTKSKKYSSC